MRVQLGTGVGVPYQIRAKCIELCHDRGRLSFYWNTDSFSLELFDTIFTLWSPEQQQPSDAQRAEQENRMSSYML